MSGDTSFGGHSVTVSYTDQWVHTTGIGLPTGRALADGTTKAGITALSAYVSGRGSSQSIQLDLGPATTSSFSVSSASSAASTGFRSTGLDIVNGGTATFTITSVGGGSFWFGRSSSGTSTDSYGTSFGGVLGGSYRWVEGPSTPLTLALAASPGGKVDVTWAAPSSNGGTSITGYQLQYDDNSGFTSPTTVDLGVVTTYQITGLTSGSTVYVRVAAKNALSTAAGTVGVRSASQNITVLSGGKVRVSGAWKDAVIKVRVGGVWKDAIVKVRVSGAWHDAT